MPLVQASVFAPVDVHRAGAADALAAGAAEGQRRIDLVLDPDAARREPSGRNRRGRRNRCRCADSRRRPGSSDRCGTRARRFAPAGFGQVLPSAEREFLGRVNSTMVSLYPRPSSEISWPSELGSVSVHPRLRLDVLDLVASSCRCAPAGSRSSTAVLVVVEPGQRVLHPVLVVAVGEVLAGMGAAAFVAVRARLPSSRPPGTIRLSNSSVSIRSEFQISERSVTRDVGRAAPDLVDQLLALRQHLAGAEHGAVVLHRASACRARSSAVGVPPLALRKRSRRDERAVGRVASAARRASRPA